ncbi:hypothetical protein PHYSODRAFT_470600 [Phytophthora sojae]|uniref:Uncharacterized protein n=1 Tax=Phytophthora sojae (strain P6497) TaxID=1094619 RepID=G4YN93_PHYSP|nr:hypothetical protein PHYSODRAFT_470600 [Phytophthora sojae]EGZ30046.1 hypothetical protein PHYSODRAFT_470600 [Phytophthora sojae]|eukprot:XP_009517321.1 hypothetical protein PHYSODRAFT_470600 [Phytophthora sojae]
MDRTGSSALTLAITRKNNTLVALLLSSGASRATISNEMWLELQVASWIRLDVRQMLSPDWAVVWSPALHRHFSSGEREKCRLVIYANAWKDEAMQQLWRVVAALSRATKADENHVRWRYLAPPLIFHILEYAVFLW